MTGRFLAGLAAALLALGLAAPKAHAVVIYDWTGTCDEGCTGQATAVLTLADTFVPGTSFADNDVFVSFSYSSSSVSFAVPGDSALSRFFATFPREVSGPATPWRASVSSQGFEVSYRFDTGPSGDWGLNFDRPSEPFSDRGVDGLWTLRASELSAPGPLSLLALGLAGLALTGRRRDKTRT